MRLKNISLVVKKESMGDSELKLLLRDLRIFHKKVKKKNQWAAHNWS